MIYFTQLCKVALSALLLLPITVDAEPLHIGSITNEYLKFPKNSHSRT
jgi:hypothetical protein